MCHPGLDDASTRHGYWRYHWPDELSALIDPKIADYPSVQGRAAWRHEWPPAPPWP